MVYPSPMFLLAKPIGWFLTRYAYRWFALACAWLVVLVALFPLLWVAQQAANAGGWVLGLVVLLLGLYFLGAVIVLAFVASLYRLAKSVREALGFGPPETPKILK